MLESQEAIMVRFTPFTNFFTFYQFSTYYPSNFFLSGCALSIQEAIEAVDNCKR